MSVRGCVCMLVYKNTNTHPLKHVCVSSRIRCLLCACVCLGIRWVWVRVQGYLCFQVGVGVYVGEQSNSWHAEAHH
jgi:hypothetical protein